MYHIIAATTNPAKLQAIHQAFCACFGEYAYRIDPLKVASGVPAQPLGCEQTLHGARTRLRHARVLQPQADFWLAIEAGIEDNSTFSWIVIESASQYSQARSASLPLPDCVMQKILNGDSLAQAIGALTGTAHCDTQQGAIGLLTGGKLTRASVCQQAIMLALSPFRHALYRADSNPPALQ